MSRSTRWPNGLEVILSEDHRVPLVGVDVWYHVGPAHEAPGRTGFAHLFEHMMFQGSKHIESDAHFKLLAGAGATGVNGTTDFDRTNYFETMPSNQLELALWLESDRMGYLLETVDQAKLSNQQDVVRNERRQSRENRPYGIVEEAMFQALFPQGSSLPWQRHRIARRYPGRKARRRERIFQPVLRTQQRDDCDRRRHRQGGDQETHREVLWHAEARARCSAGQRARARHHFGAPARGRRSRGAAATLHGVDYTRLLQRRRRRRRSREQHPRTGARQSPLQEARVRKTDRAGRERVSGTRRCSDRFSASRRPHGPAVR